MKKSSVFSLLFFLFGLGILAFSLSSSSFSLQSAYRSTNDQKPLAKLFSGEVLPGHPWYLFVMFQERMRLLFTRDQEHKALVYMEYARERLTSAKKLFLTAEYDLAIPTLAKGQMYLGLATGVYQDMQKHNRSVSHLSLPMSEALVTYQEEMMVMKDQLDDAQRVRIDQLVQYNLALQSAFPQELRE